MSMQSHLSELEKKHQALESEINECLAHPAKSAKESNGRKRRAGFMGEGIGWRRAEARFAQANG